MNFHTYINSSFIIRLNTLSHSNKFLLSLQNSQRLFYTSRSASSFSSSSSFICLSKNSCSDFSPKRIANKYYPSIYSSNITLWKNSCEQPHRNKSNKSIDDISKEDKQLKNDKKNEKEKEQNQFPPSPIEKVPVDIKKKRLQELNDSAKQLMEEDEDWKKAETKFGAILDMYGELPLLLEEEEEEEEEEEKEEEKKENNNNNNSNNLPPYFYDEFLASVFENIAFCQQNQGKRETAATNYLKALKIYKICDNEGIQLGRTLINYSEVMASLGKIEEAEKHCRHAIELIEKNYGESSEFTGAVLSNLGGYLCAQTKFKEAEPILKRAVEVLHATLGRKNEFTQSAVTNYVQLLKETGNEEELALIKKKFLQEIEHLDILEKMKQPESEEVIKISKEWEDKKNQLLLDPSGFFKSSEFSKEELVKFLDHMKKQGKQQMDADQLESIAKEWENLNEDEFTAMFSKAATEVLAKPNKDQQNEKFVEWIEDKWKSEENNNENKQEEEEKEEEEKKEEKEENQNEEDGSGKRFFNVFGENLENQKEMIEMMEEEEFLTQQQGLKELEKQEKEKEKEKIHKK